MYRSNSFKFERRAPAAADPAGPAPAAAAAPVSRATPLPPQRRHQQQQQQQQQVIAQQQHKLRRAGARQVTTANTTAWPLHLHLTFHSAYLHEHYEQTQSLHHIAVSS